MNSQHPLPPRWMINILRWFCPPHLFEEIEGDLIERYACDIENAGIRCASWRLFKSVVLFFRPGIVLRNRFSFEPAALFMLSNYLKISLRVMSRNLTFTTINVSGLVLGITGAMLLFLWIHHEFTYENFHQDRDRIHVVWKKALDNGQYHVYNYTPRILAPTLEKEFTGVEHAVSYAKWDSKHLFRAGNTKLMTASGVYTDPAFLKVLTYPIVKGNPDYALAEPNSIVLTESFARRLFGDKEAMGEPLSISQEGYTFEFIVSGILSDLPGNTDFDFEYLLSFRFLESLGENNADWDNNSVMTLVKLKAGVQLTDFNKQVRNFEKKHNSGSQHIELFLYPLEKIRLYSNFENGVPSGGRIDVMQMLGILGLCLLLIASINFINLSTARAQRRAKEVAVRKVTGAVRFAIIAQFLVESLTIATIASVVAAALAWMLLPSFNVLIGEQITFNMTSPWLWVAFLALTIAVGLLAGSFPAFYLSSFLPVRILKGGGVSPGRVGYVRAGLVVLQFGFAVTMIVAAIVVSRQITFLQQRESGYDRDLLIHIPLTGDLGRNYNLLKQELLSNGIAVSVTKTSGSLAEQFSGTTDMRWSGRDPEDRTDVERIYFDEAISATAGLHVIEGRDLDLARFPSDSAAMLINETAAKLMAFKNPIGERVIDSGREYTIVGVVKDFVFTSPFRKVEPIVLMGSKQSWSFNVVYIKLDQQHPVQENLARMRSLVRKYNPDYPFEYQFADLEYQQKFDSINKTLTLTAIFTTASIFIACLGLFGLSIFMTETRLKEIGVRKVMGGSVLSITKLLGMASLKPVFVAMILFTPLSWWAMSWWLESFAFRISLDFSVFVSAGVLVVLIAMATIIAQTLRAATINPVRTLRSE